jgi:hypothetical protein
MILGRSNGRILLEIEVANKKKNFSLKTKINIVRNKES